jgi:hypothetical protein
MLATLIPPNYNEILDKNSANIGFSPLPSDSWLMANYNLWKIN